MKNGVVHWEIGTTDPAKTGKFYSELFDWDMDHHEGMNYHMAKAAGEGAIGGGIGPLEGGMSPYVTFYVEVEDLQASLDKAVKLGGKQIVPPTEIPGGLGSIAWFADPDGHTIGLWKGAETK